MQTFLPGYRILSHNLRRLHWVHWQHNVYMVQHLILVYIYGTIFNFSYDNENHQWIAASSIAPTFKAVSGTGSVLRSQEWTVHNDSKLCGGSYTAMLSFSSCTIEQFTCSDGNCVDMDKR